MDKKLKFILVFLGSGIAMFLIFYLYPAQIFDVHIEGRMAQSDTEVSLKAFLGLDTEFTESLRVSDSQMTTKLSGWMILIIITIGMPLMFAYRTLVQKTPRKTEE